MDNDKMNISGRIWIDKGKISFLGEGRVSLLKKIAEYGSLRKAASSMEMSYKKAWLSVKKMNELAGSPLVILSRGGKKGGVAILTPEAINLLEKYDSLMLDFDDFLITQDNKWNQD
jgi:molybdate transport system regulatory protein